MTTKTIRDLLPLSVGRNDFDPNTIFDREGNSVASLFGIPLHVRVSGLEAYIADSPNRSEARALAVGRALAASPGALADILSLIGREGEHALSNGTASALLNDIRAIAKAALGEAE